MKFYQWSSGPHNGDKILLSGFPSYLAVPWFCIWVHCISFFRAPQWRRTRNPAQGGWAASTCVAGRDLCHQPTSGPKGGHLLPFTLHRGYWRYLEKPFAFSPICGKLFLELPVFQGRSAAGGFGKLVSLQKSQHLLISCPLPLLSCFYVTMARKFTAAFSSTKWSISCKSKRWLSLQVIPSPASPDPASSLDFWSPLAPVSSPRCKERILCKLLPLHPPLPLGYRHGSFLLQAPSESLLIACPSLQGEAIGVRWLEACAALQILTPANYTMY